MNTFRLLVAAVRAALRGKPCDRCGTTTAATTLVVKAVRCYRRPEGPGGTMITTYKAKRADFLCPTCREDDDGELA